VSNCVYIAENSHYILSMKIVQLSDISPFSIICQQEVNWFRSRLPNINRENMYKWYQKKLY
jgi:hypothetical protein